jgi:hypothetical protein
VYVQASRLKTAAPFLIVWLSTPAPPEQLGSGGLFKLPFKA